MSNEGVPPLSSQGHSMRVKHGRFPADLPLNTGPMLVETFSLTDVGLESSPMNTGLVPTSSKISSSVGQEGDQTDPVLSFELETRDLATNPSVESPPPVVPFDIAAPIVTTAEETETVMDFLTERNLSSTFLHVTPFSKLAVIEFYYSLSTNISDSHNEHFHQVFVRGKWYDFSADVINAYFGFDPTSIVVDEVDETSDEFLNKVGLEVSNGEVTEWADGDAIGEEVAATPKKNFQIVHQTIEALASVPSPEFALRLYLQCAEAANDYDLEPVAYGFFTQAFVLYEEEYSAKLLKKLDQYRAVYAYDGTGDGDPGPEHYRPAPLREDFGEEVGGGHTEERDVAPLPDLLPLSGGPTRRPAWGDAAPPLVPPLLGPHRPPLPRSPRLLRRRRPNSPLHQRVPTSSPSPSPPTASRSSRCASPPPPLPALSRRRCGQWTSRSTTRSHRKAIWASSRAAEPCISTSSFAPSASWSPPPSSERKIPLWDQITRPIHNSNPQKDPKQSKEYLEVLDVEDKREVETMKQTTETMYLYFFERGNP
ncbi:vacuolar protein sorting-associated protein 35B isoform X3 [Canna indica]|uniref:Vacuolar protein sorting-associated protein 35B isoform X3 n=1 Tax=Canna indica TaxID=4628 RepID=A0AAQ3QT94_9LILI|nr:vacuolar protein sorting-associated protein 35B isoform X3 [Canna indica]